MESDCKDEAKTFTSNSTASSSNDEILKILTAISSQMVVGHRDLQSQLISHNLHLKEELQKVKEENEKFRQEIRAELSSTTSTQPVLSSSVIPTVSTSVPIVNQVLPMGVHLQVIIRLIFNNRCLLFWTIPFQNYQL